MHGTELVTGVHRVKVISVSSNKMQDLTKRLKTLGAPDWYKADCSCEACDVYRNHIGKKCPFTCRFCPNEPGWSPLPPLKRARRCPPAPIKTKAVWYKPPNLEKINEAFFPSLEQQRQTELSS